MKSRVKQKCIEDTSLAEEVDRNWSEVVEQNYLFDRTDCEVSNISVRSYVVVVQLLEKVFFSISFQLSSAFMNIPDVVAPSRMVGVFASVNIPLHHKVQKFSSGTGSPGWSQKKGRKTVVVWWWWCFDTVGQLTATTSLVSDLPVHAQFPVNSPLSPSITPSFFHSRLKTYLFHNLSHHRLRSWPQDGLHGLMTGPFLLSISVFVLVFFITIFCLVPCGRLSWLCQLLCARIVSYRFSSRTSGGRLPMGNWLTQLHLEHVCQRAGGGVGGLCVLGDSWTSMIWWSIRHAKCMSQV